MRDLALLAFNQCGRLDILRRITGHAQHDQCRLQRRQAWIEGGVFRVAAAKEAAVLGLQGDAGVTLAVGGIALRGGLGRCLQQAIGQQRWHFMTLGLQQTVQYAEIARTKCGG